MSEHDDRLRELGKELPWDRPEPVRRDAVRSSLLVAAAERDARPNTRWYVIGGAFAAGAIAAAAAVLLFVHGSDKPAPVVSKAQISASLTAQFDRHITRTPTGVDEVVRLRAGTLSMAVGALRAGDHVRVATRDAEVEGDGSYDVVVVGDELRDVKVTDGHATIRMTGQQAVFLSTGQSWSAHAIVAHDDVTRIDDVAQRAPIPAPPPSVIAPAKPVADAAVIPPVRQQSPAKPRPRIETTATDRHDIVVGKPADTTSDGPATESTAKPENPGADKPIDPAVENPVVATPPPAPTGPKEVERRFQSGMALLKAGKAAEAARELTAAADAGGDDPLAADARYFAAVALTKAGRKTEAERALVTFIDRAPTSIRRGRAAVMLARLIAERGDKAAARAWFESALGDADPAVVSAARAGIAATK
ncbi:MAG TPA: tetratricopeptide repeat protein [Kofleriaceae bacterium]